MDIKDIIMVLAVIAGPILAVQAQRIVEERKQGRERKIRVFKDLMATRASLLAYQHVAALNLVGLEFQEKKYSKVLDNWKTYIDQLFSAPNEPTDPKDSKAQSDYDILISAWADKKNEMLTDFLYEMGNSLGFNFDRVHIKKAGYIPKAYGDQEVEQNFIRRSMVNVLKGNAAIPLNIVSFPGDSEAIELQKKLHKKLMEYYQGMQEGKPALVKIVNDQSE